jgi:hypothetical protein
MERPVKDMTDEELAQHIVMGSMLLSCQPDGAESAEIAARGQELYDELELRKGWKSK